MRDYFPFFKNRPDIVYLDTAATSQTLQSVIDDQLHFLTHEKSNAHRSGHSMGTVVDSKYHAAKELIGKWLDIPNPLNQVIFNSGSSQGLNDAVQLIEQKYNSGTIFLGVDAHHSLLLPIQKLVSRNSNWKLVYIEVNNFGYININQLDAELNKHTGNKVIAVTAISNVLGKINNLHSIKSLSAMHNAVTILDASQIIGKRKFSADGFDFVAWSWHKVYGPTGLGCLVVDSKWTNSEPLRPGGGTVTGVTFKSHTWLDSAQRFETGTQNLQAIVAIPNLVNWLMAHENDIELHDFNLAVHIDQLVDHLKFKVASCPDSGLISMLPLKLTAEDFAMMLDSQKIMTRAGKMCAQPLIDDITLNKSLLRISWGPYTTIEEIEIAVNTMTKIYDKF